MNKEIAIRVKNLSKIYKLYNAPIDRLKEALNPFKKKYHKEFFALNDISFEVKKGDCVGIVGRNGSGKSTLLKIITGVLTQTSGEVIVNGRVAALLELGAGFNPEYTGLENIFFNGNLLGYTRSEMAAKLDEIIDFADIGEHISQPVKTYSSGMLVRLAFAVQSIIDPDILIVDEALAVGDALFQKKCFQQLEKLRSKGVTLLFVSHDQESVRSLTNHAVLLKSGVVHYSGLSSDVLLAYRKLLHDEESVWFSHVAEVALDKKNKQQNEVKQISNVPIESRAEIVSATDIANLVDRKSFGNSLATINNTTVLNSALELCSIFYPKDKIIVKIEFIANVDLLQLNVGIRIRNKEGIKIYSWGTLNQDIEKISRGEKDDLYWNKKFIKGRQYLLNLEFECTLGLNLYEIQSSISYEGNPNYTEQRVLHWVDEAAYFQVLIKQDEYPFGGTVDLKAIAYE